MSKLGMRRIAIRHLKNSGSSNVQVPASGATITLYRQGATVSTSSLEVFEQDTVTVDVLDVGRIALGDYVWVSRAPGLDFLVLGITETSLELEYEGNQPLTIQSGDRIYPVAAVPSYSDSMGTNALSSIVTDANGYAAFSCPESKFDYRLEDAGSASGFFIDVEGGWGRSTPAQVNARDFPSIQSAIDSIPAVGGTVFIPAGVYEMTDTLYLPCDRPVHLVGEGRHEVTTMGTVLHWNSQNGMLRVRGDFSSVRGITLVNDWNSGASREDRGYGIMIGRRNVVDAHPPLGVDPGDPPTEYVAGGSKPSHAIVIEDVSVIGAPGWALYIPGYGELSNGTTAEYDRVMPSATEGGTLSFWIECRRLRTSASKTYGALFVGKGCTTTHFIACGFLQQGPLLGATLPETYYAYVANCEQPIFERCTFEGLSAVDLPWLQFHGTQDPILDCCWFENDPPDSPTAPSPFVSLRGGCNAGGIRHCRFIRAARNTALNVLSIEVDGAQGLQVLNPGGVAVESIYDGATNTYSDAHFDFGDSPGLQLSGSGCFVNHGGSSDQEPRPFQYSNAHRRSQLSGQHLTRLPRLSSVELDDPTAGDPSLHQDGNLVMNDDLGGDASGIRAPMYKTGTADSLPIWKLANNFPLLTTTQRDSRTRWADGDVIINVTDSSNPVMQVRYGSTWRSLAL